MPLLPGCVHISGYQLITPIRVYEFPLENILVNIGVLSQRYEALGAVGFGVYPRGYGLAVMLHDIPAQVGLDL